MKELFLPYELSLLAKEFGFDEPCIARYNKGNFELNRLGNWYKHNSGEIEKHYLSAPLYQQMITFLRDRFGLIIEIQLDQTSDIKWCYEIIKFNSAGDFERKTNVADWSLYRDCNECLDAGIKEALKLI